MTYYVYKISSNWRAIGNNEASRLALFLRERVKRKLDTLCCYSCDSGSKIIRAFMEKLFLPSTCSRRRALWLYCISTPIVLVCSATSLIVCRDIITLLSMEKIQLEAENLQDRKGRKRKETRVMWNILSQHYDMR